MEKIARLPMGADRYNPCVKIIRVVGLDLSSAAMRFQVRLKGDTPGAPLVALTQVTTTNTEGLRVVLTFEGGMPVSTVWLQINKPTMATLPFGGELGDATVLTYGLNATLGGRERAIAMGAFVLPAMVVGADGAPSNRPGGVGSTGDGYIWDNAQLTFGDELVEVSIEGADALGPLVVAAEAAVAQSAANVTASQTARTGSEAAQARAELAREVTLANAVPFSTSLAQGEASSPTVGSIFRTVINGVATWWQRTTGASTSLYSIVTAAALASGIGTSFIGHQPLSTFLTVARDLRTKLAEFKSIRDFDAKGDGVTDDTAAIQRAIDHANTTGDTLWVPAGDYLAANLQMRSGVRFVGVGVRRVFGANGVTFRGSIIRKNANLPLFRVDGTSVLTGGPQIEDCQFTNLMFHGSDMASDIFRVRAAAKFLWDRCFFLGTARAWYDCWELFDSTFRDCRFEYGGSDGGTAATRFAAGVLGSGAGDGTATWEYTNNVTFTNTTWETYRWRFLDIRGTNTNHISVVNSKAESKICSTWPIEVVNAYHVDLHFRSFSTKGQSGIVIAQQMLFYQSKGIRVWLPTEIMDHNLTGTGNPAEPGNGPATWGTCLRFDGCYDVLADITINQLSAPKFTSGYAATQVNSSDVTKFRVSCSTPGINAFNAPYPVAPAGVLQIVGPAGVEPYTSWSRSDRPLDIWQAGRVAPDGPTSTTWRLIHVTANGSFVGLSVSSDHVIRNVDGLRIEPVRSGTTAERPLYKPKGTIYKDDTIQKLIVRKSASPAEDWMDAMGAAV